MRRSKGRSTTSSSSLTDEELARLSQELRQIHEQQAALLERIAAEANARNTTVRGAAITELTYGFGTESNLSARQTHPHYPPRPFFRPLRTGDTVTILDCVLVNGRISNHNDDYIGTIIRIKQGRITVQTKSNRLLQRTYHSLVGHDE